MNQLAATKVSANVELLESGFRINGLPHLQYTTLSLKNPAFSCRIEL